MSLTIHTANHIGQTMRTLVQDAVGRNGQGESILVLCPDSYTQAFERDIFFAHPSGGSFSLDVYSFTRLLYHLYEDDSTHYLSRYQGVMALKKIIRENEGSLTALGRSAQSKGFAEKLYDLLQKLYQEGFDLSHAQKQPLSYKLLGRINDLKLLSDAYQQFLQKGFADSSHMQKRLPSLLAQGKLGKKTVLIGGFIELNTLELNAISALLELHYDVHIYCTRLSENHIANKIYDAITALAYRQNIPFEEYTSTPLSSPVFEYLFYEIPFASNDSKGVIPYLATGKEDEINQIAQSIHYAVYAEGYRYRDISLCLPKPEGYSTTVKKIFRDYGIPLFISEKKRAIEHPLCRFLLCYLSVIEQNCKMQSVLALIKNACFYATTEEKAAFESYILKYGINYNAFLQPFTHEDGLTEMAEGVRMRLNELLLLYPVKKAPANALAAVLSSLLQNEGVLLALKELNRFIEAEGDLDYIAYAKQAQETPLTLLSDIATMFEDTLLNAEELKDLLEEGFFSLQIASAPVESDAVFIGNFRTTLPEQKKLVFVAGLSDGFPPTAEAGGLLSDRDLSELLINNIPLDLSVQYLTERNRFEAFSLASETAERLYLSAVKSGETGGFPSVIEGLLQCYPKVGVKTRAMITLTEENDPVRASMKHTMLKHSPKTGSFRFFESLQAAREGQFHTEKSLFLDALYSALCSTELGDKLQNALIEDTQDYRQMQTEGLYFYNNTTSVSRIESFFRCPFRHFLQYGLRLSEQEIADLQPLDIGNFLHAVAERYVKEKYVQKNAPADRIEHTLALCNAISKEPDFARYFTSAEGFSVLKPLKKEALRLTESIDLQLSAGKFSPWLIEESFGTGKTLAPIAIPNTPYVLTGKIDRADIACENGKKYIRIVDYKTGSTKMSRAELAEGTQMQLFVYLSALTAGNELLPLGVYYLPIKDKFGDKINYKLEGRTLSDPDLLHLTDKALARGESSLVVQLAINKNGTVKKGAHDITAEEFEEICAQVMQKLTEACLLIAKGEHSPKPSGKCEYCAYHTVCERSKQEENTKGEESCDEGNE